MAKATQNAAVAAPVDAALPSGYFAWGAVLAGASIALAITVVLTGFGGGVGLSYDAEAIRQGQSAWPVFVAGLWIVLMALASSTAGGYIAGRMRGRWLASGAEEVEFRDGCQGLAVWAVSTVVMAAAVNLATILGGLAASAGPDPASLSDDVLRVLGNADTIMAFSAGAGAALGAGAAWFAAVLGGEHRDGKVGTSALLPGFMRTK